MKIKKKIKIKINPEYASLVHPFSEEEYNSVKQSIEKEGQYYPIIINQDGIILDGHHRYKICTELGIEPQCFVRRFEDKLDEKMFVFDSNLRRRQLTLFQKVELAFKMKPILQEIAKRNESLGGKGVKDLTPLGRVDEEVGKLAGVSYGTVRKFEKIIKCFPQEHLDKVRAGEISINQAYNGIILSERIESVKEKLHLDLQKILPEIEKIEEEIIRLAKLLTDKDEAEKQSVQQRKELRLTYVRKLREHYDEILCLKMLSHRTALTVMSLVAKGSDLESKTIKFLEEIDRIIDYKSKLDDLRSRVEGKGVNEGNGT
jgi:ParB-like chromosome segregation protein Spo0J